MADLEALLKKFPRTLEKLNDGNNKLKEALEELKKHQHTQSSEKETFSKKIQISKETSTSNSSQSK